jgi:hypothetical protein
MFLTLILEPLVPPLTGDSLFASESRLIILAVVVALAFPNLGAEWFRRTEKLCGRVAAHRSATVWLIGILTLAIRAALLPWMPIPSPGVADEFSYLLQADTFAHARLANPTPPLWPFFDTLHVLLHPTYASKYPPLQGAVLAVGQVLFGHAWVGVLVSVAVMCAAICWMLLGWVPSRWALFGGLLAVIRLGTFSYWMNTYWGGAVAAIGGTLVLGSLPRIVRQGRLHYAWTMGLGLAILANSRPYEGAILAFPAAAILLVWMTTKKSPPLPVLLRRVVLPLVVWLVAIAAATGYYNWKVTGSPLVFPYQVHLAQYVVTPPFLWQPLRPDPPAYTDARLRNFHLFEESISYERAHSLHGFLHSALARLEITDAFYLGPVLTLPFIMLPWMVRDGRIRPLLWVGAAMLVGLMCESWFLPHYASPATALIYALLVQATRYLRVWSVRRRPVGRMMARAIPLICLIMFGVRLHAGSSSQWAWFGDRPGNQERARISEELEKQNGGQLVIVRYGPQYPADEEWVYNLADIAAAKVVWARDKGYAADQTLIEHFPDRRVWLLELDRGEPKLEPFPSATAGASGLDGRRARGVDLPSHLVPDTLSLQRPREQ